MEEARLSQRIIRFGVFEVDLGTSELRKRGIKVKVSEQPFQILAMLLERPGELLTREEIQQKLWPDGTLVDYDHSINTAINKIREALGDSADNPRFVETLARRGYRFIASLQGIEHSPNSQVPTAPPNPLSVAMSAESVADSSAGSEQPAASSLPTQPTNRVGPPSIEPLTGETPPAASSREWVGESLPDVRPGLRLSIRWWTLVLAGLATLLAVAMTLWWNSPPPQPKIVGSSQITDDGRMKTRN
ncbi:MAG: winged helix-turn-helix domain-containing protein, partial [Terriglobia bacterium]